MFGNTEEIARAIADGLGESFDVQLAEVSDAPHGPDPEVALIVAGGPTHAFSMSRTNTRADAINRGATEGERDFGLREWMASLRSGQHAAKIATFDTKIESMRLRPGQRQKAPRRLPAAMGTTRPQKRKASMFERSTVRWWRVRLIGHGLGPGSSLHR